MLLALCSFDGHLNDALLDQQVAVVLGQVVIRLRLQYNCTAFCLQATVLA